ncbi:MAG: formylglycine-generating enzyme family protein [Thermoanaerobaculia bacterium]|nr:formylglycine-generating enzyme family protein [Thermoanaerobaculia bacterium]
MPEVQHLAEVLEIVPADIDQLRARLNGYQRLARWREECDPVRAYQWYRRATAIAERAARRTNDEPRALTLLWDQQTALARFEVLADPDAARRTFERAFSTAERGLRIQPGWAGLLRRLARSCEDLAGLAAGPEEERSWLRKAMTARSSLLQLEPGDTESRRALERDRRSFAELAAGATGPMSTSVGPRRRHLGRLRKGAVEIREHLERAKRLARRDPLAAIEAADRASMAALRGLFLGECGDPEGLSHDELVCELFDLSFFPDRLVHPLGLVEFLAEQDENSLGVVPVFGHAPAVHCTRAAARIADWYVMEYLGAATEPTAVSDRDFPVGYPVRVGDFRRVQGTRLSPTPVPRNRCTVLGGASPLEPPLPLHPTQEEAALRLGVPPMIVDGVTGMVLVLIPGGVFQMGASPEDELADASEYPRHRACVRPFYCGVGPVLQREWGRVMDENPSLFLGDRRPVEGVSQEEVADFLDKVNLGRAGPPLRLLREAEWELAARGGTATAYWWGPRYQAGWSNCAEDGLGSGLQETSEVGRFPANPFGLFDLLGNVAELCEDSWNPDFRGAPRFATQREALGVAYGVLRGGSWAFSPADIRASSRWASSGAESENDCAYVTLAFEIGFRCALDVDESRRQAKRGERDA